MTILLETEYVEVDCGHESHGPGGFSFAMTRRFYDETRRTGSGWYCPMGHRRIWKGKTVEQQLKAAQSRETALQDQLEAAIREGETTRLRDEAVALVATKQDELRRARAAVREANSILRGYDELIEAAS